MIGPEVLTVGEAMVVLRSDGLLRLGGSVTPSVAGAESNVAIGLARLGHRVEWAGRLGADECGELILRTLRAEGVGVTHVRRDPAPTGIMVHEQRLPGVAIVDYHRAGSAGSRLDGSEVEATLEEGPPRVLHVTGVTAALSGTARGALATITRRARDRGTLVSLDLNYRRRLWSRVEAAKTLRSLLPWVDVVIASEDELGLVADDPAELLDAGVEQVVVKRGARGAVGHARGQFAVEVPAPVVTAVDAVGAGDAFCAGFLSGLLEGLPLPDRLARGVRLGAFAVTGRGDWEHLPRRAELSLLDRVPGDVVR